MLGDCEGAQMRHSLNRQAWDMVTFFSCRLQEVGPPPCTAILGRFPRRISSGRWSQRRWTLVCPAGLTGGFRSAIFSLIAQHLGFRLRDSILRLFTYCPKRSGNRARLWRMMWGARDGVGCWPNGLQIGGHDATPSCQ
jgi:hypothetical protein